MINDAMNSITLIPMAMLNDTKDSLKIASAMIYAKIGNVAINKFLSNDLFIDTTIYHFLAIIQRIFIILFRAVPSPRKQGETSLSQRRF